MVKHEREGNGARESETEIDPEKKKLEETKMREKTEIGDL